MQRIDTVVNFSTGLIAYGLNDAGGKASVPLLEARAAVQWPKGKDIGYYIILGKKAAANEAGEHTLMFLVEGEEALPQALYQRLTDDVVRMRANTIYADRTSTRAAGLRMTGCYTDLYDYLGARRLSVQLSPAPSAGDKDYGVILVREHIKRQTLELPLNKTTRVREHLRGMSQDPDEEGLYAFHALRYLLAGFAKFQDPGVIDPFMVVPAQRVSAAGWT